VSDVTHLLSAMDAGDSLGAQQLLTLVHDDLRRPAEPRMAQSFVIEHRWDPVVLTGDGDEDEQTWGPINLWGRFNKYTWNIN
jgi:hypothetical protein